MKKILFYFAILFVIFSIALFLFIIFKSEIVANGGNRKYYSTYFIISIILLLISLLIFKYHSNPIWIIILSSITFSIYSFQYYLVFNNYQKKIYYYKNFDNQEKKINLLSKKNLIYDLRSRKEIYESEILGNINRTMSINPANFLLSEKKLLPLSGLPNKQTFYCNENGYYAEYLSDRNGFNNPNTEWDKNQNKVIALGDSFVNGACVNRPNDIISVLRNISKKKNLGYLNLGMDSNGPGLQLATLKEYYTKKTKFILWFYFENNDLIEATRDLKNPIIQEYLSKKNFKQDLIKKQNLINLKINRKIKNEYSKNLLKEKNLKKIKKNKEKKFSLEINYINFIKLRYLRDAFTFNNDIYHEKHINNYKKILIEAKRFSKSKNSKLVFVFLPEFARYNLPYPQRDKNYKSIMKLVKDLKIPVIDLHKDLFEKQDDPNKFFPFGMSGHYNVKGYSKVAEIISLFLDKMELE